MVDRYISCRENGERGAIRKARILQQEMGYKITNIEYTMVPQAGSRSSPYARNYMKDEPGYLITVDTNGYAAGESRDLPNIIHMI